MTAPTPPAAANLLRGVPAFSDLSAQAREELTGRCELRMFRAGAALVPPGGRWSGLGLVLSGTARLLDERHGSIPIDTLVAGAVFGHETLLSDQPFPYNAYATTDCTALLLSRAAFEEWLSFAPGAPARHARVGQPLRRQDLPRRLDARHGARRRRNESAAAAMRELRLHTGESLVTEGRTATDVS